MSKCIQTIIKADKGATLVSPNFFAIEEIVPPNTTIEEIEAGIEDGTYTPIDLDLYTYEGQIKTDYSQKTMHDLNFTISEKSTGTNSYKILTFKLLPSETDTWDNKEKQLLFDIKRTEIADTDNVDIWVKGTIQVQPVITE